MKRLLTILFFVFIIDAHAAVSSNALPFSSQENTLHSAPSLYGFVELLNWQVREGGADNWAQEIPPTGLIVPARLIDAPFAWNQGVRLGVGHVFESVGHDIEFIYTTYHTVATNQAAGIVASSFVGNYFADNTNGASLGPAYQSATIRWQFYYNMFDLNLGHRFIFLPEFELHPYVGLKLASIKQRIFSNWYNPVVATTFTSATENLRNDFLGVGPSLGVDSTWPFFSGKNQKISLIGNFVGALMYGHWVFNDVYTNNTPVNINVHVSSVNGAAPMLGGIVGFQWARQFLHSEMSVSIGYDVQAWFNQIQFYSLNGGRFNRTTFIQGVDFAARYYF